MEREEERERRRLRDRQRRQSMTNEEREQHLARRRRNYQLRRERAANAQSTATAESIANTSPHLQCLTPSTSLDHTLLHHPHQSSQFLRGSSNQLEGFPKTLRLNIIKQIARNLINPVSLALVNNQVAAEFISGSSGYGSTSKSLRLNSVKRLARSLSFHSENTAIQNSHNGTGRSTTS